jgi:hypothetical protein
LKYQILDKMQIPYICSKFRWALSNDKYGKGKVFPLQAWVGPWESGG